MKKALLIFTLMITGGILTAGNINDVDKKTDSKLIYGKVIDKKSGEEIAGAEVKINDQIIYTDLNGNFSTSVNTSKTEALVTFISYSEVKINIDPFSYNTIVVELESK